MTTPLCWKCAAPLTELLLPLARLAECSACRAELHVCKMCDFYDTRVANQCREPVAEPVSDKTRANFCGYFQLCLDANNAPEVDASQTARAQLDALFGAAATRPAASDATLEALNQLFGNKPSNKKE